MFFMSVVDQIGAVSDSLGALIPSAVTLSFVADAEPPNLSFHRLIILSIRGRPLTAIVVEPTDTVVPLLEPDVDVELLLIDDGDAIDT